MEGDAVMVVMGVIIQEEMECNQVDVVLYRTITAVVQRNLQ